MRHIKTARLALIAGMTSLVFGLGSLDASAQERTNKGGEVRGKDRVEQVKGANDLKEKKAKKAKKTGKAKKEKKAKKAEKN